MSVPPVVPSPDPSATADPAVRPEPAGGPVLAARERWQVRPWRDGDEVGLRRLGELAFGFTPTADRWADDQSTLERDRMVFVVDPLDPSAIVGTAGAYSYLLSVPGGRSVPAAGVSWVAASPTRRRQGILRALMGAQLTDVAARGEPLAILWCSETTIYGRFGYGHASSEIRISVDRHRAALDPAVLAGAEPLRAEIGEPLASLAEVESLYETVRLIRPGMPRRDEHWQRLAVTDHESDRAGASSLRAVLFRDAGGTVRAAARYRVSAWTPDPAAGGRRVQVSELYADSPGAGAVAWSWLGDLDLVGGYDADTRATDDPLLLQLADGRAATVKPVDSLWVRLVDLPVALAARAYGTTAEVVLEVADPMLPANAGRWRLRTTPGGATVDRTTAPPDIGLDTAVLARAYLGQGGSLVRSWQAGQLTQHRDGAVSELSRSFDSDLAPWCPVHF